MKILNVKLTFAALAAIFAVQPAAAAPCKAGPYMVFFEPDSDELTASAKMILDNVASAFKGCDQTQVMISGHTDTPREADYNVGLSQRMANNVRAYLNDKGVPAGVMTVEAFGESRPLIDAGDKVAEPQNRRVEITVGAGAGW
ncbi:OmpA family protein [Sphingomonas sinipercae]|uniref:OmpA family protein n=1 Tax=Sphingomonas sinipercae TaxID=2714944 RepID=A0A6G7ZPR3_9SPHN|nr:OmpA family protein [Sphingomonas sinipercae]QIL02961.1 OmpA family protein [Sphingomonas sinipercae]